jgi:predicted phosphate transport protein (TIGR00153 family)
MSLLQLISASPFKALSSHMDRIDECMSHLKTLIEATYQEDYETVTQQHLLIRQCEQEADEIKRSLRTQLHRDLLLPISRHELLKLITLQDGIANISKDIAGLIHERHLAIPKTLHTTFSQLMQDVEHCYQALAKTNQLLSRLVKQVFNQSVAEEISELLAQLDGYERASDETQHLLRQQLFQQEDNLPPIEAMHLYQLIHLTGMLADQCQTIGSHVLFIIAH